MQVDAKKMRQEENLGLKITESGKSVEEYDMPIS